MYAHILVAFDGSGDGYQLLDEAIALAGAARAKVQLASIVHLSPSELLAETAYPSGMHPREEKKLQDALVDVGRRFAAQGCAVETHLIVGNDPAATICALAQDLKVDLIVLGHHRRGTLSRLWNGSVGQSVLADAPCSVLVAMNAGVPA
jgi:nucleotide-binding universal stress UspA family protein